MNVPRTVWPSVGDETESAVCACALVSGNAAMGNATAHNTAICEKRRRDARVLKRFFIGKLPGLAAHHDGLIEVNKSTRRAPLGQRTFKFKA